VAAQEPFDPSPEGIDADAYDHATDYDDQKAVPKRADLGEPRCQQQEWNGADQPQRVCDNRRSSSDIDRHDKLSIG
jgi:hypothetical protein